MRFISFALCGLLLSGCTAGDSMQAVLSEVDTDTTVAKIAGKYYHGDGLGCNITLILKSDATYSAEWYGCLGKYGDARGTWKPEADRIQFFPESESGMLKDELAFLDVLNIDCELVLVPIDEASKALLQQHGVSRYSCYQRQKEEP